MIKHAECNENENVIQLLNIFIPYLMKRCSLLHVFCLLMDLPVKRCHNLKAKYKQETSVIKTACKIQFRSGRRELKRFFSVFL